MDRSRVGIVDLSDVARVAEKALPADDTDDGLADSPTSSRPRTAREERLGRPAREEQLESPPPKGGLASIGTQPGGKLLDHVCHQSFVRSLRTGSPPAVRARLKKPQFAIAESFTEAHVASAKSLASQRSLTSTPRLSAPRDGS